MKKGAVHAIEGAETAVDQETDLGGVEKKRPATETGVETAAETEKLTDFVLIATQREKIQVTKTVVAHQLTGPATCC